MVRLYCISRLGAASLGFAVQQEPEVRYCRPLLSGASFRRVLSAELVVRPIMADAVDGKVLSGDVPYDFVAKTRQGKTVLVKKVKLITVKPGAAQTSFPGSLRNPL